MKENMRSIIIGVIALVIVVAGIAVLVKRNTTVDVQVSMSENLRTIDEESVEIGDGGLFDAAVSDNPEYVGSISETSEEHLADEADDVSGSLVAKTSDGAFQFLALFEGLREPEEGTFYEGWLVRRKPFAFVSTGQLMQEGDVWVNRYASTMEDIEEFDFYTVTLEEDDGDEAPSDIHVAEGELESIEEEPENTEGVEGEEAEGNGNGDVLGDTTGDNEVGETMPAGQGGSPASFTGTVVAGSSSPLLSWNAAGYQEMLSSGRLVVLYFISSDCETCVVEHQNALTVAFDSLVRSDVVGMIVSLDGTDEERGVASNFMVENPNTKVIIVGGDAVASVSSDEWTTVDYLSVFGS